MASIVSRQQWASSTSDSNTHSPTLPGSISPGDLLLCVFSSDGSPTISTSSTGWNKVGQRSNGANVSGALFWKIATGSDALTVNLTANEQATAITFRITGAVAVNCLGNDGSSTNANPSNLDNFLSKEYLLIATAHIDSTVVASSAPSGYSNLTTQSAGGTGGASTSVADRTATVSAENPGAFTSSNEQWVTFTIAIIPDDGLPFIHVGEYGQADQLQATEFSDTTTQNITGFTFPQGLPHPGLLVFVSGFNNDVGESGNRVINSMTWNSDSMTGLVNLDQDDPIDYRDYFFYIDNPDAGNNTLSITWAGEIEDVGVLFIPVGNVASDQPDAVNSSYVTSSSSPSIGITTTVDNALVFASASLNADPGNMGGGANTTEISPATFNFGGFSIVGTRGVVSSAGSVTTAFTNGESTNYVMLSVALAPFEDAPVESNIKQVSNIDLANIKRIAGVDIGNIAKFMGVEN